jgi:hypothetical protein
MKLVILALVPMAALAACAGYAAPSEHLASAEASLRAAQEIGAESNPKGALHLRLAQEELASARQLMSSGDNERADYVLMRARADGDLALTLARASKAKTDASQAEKKADEVQSPAVTPQPIAPQLTMPQPVTPQP